MTHSFVSSVRILLSAVSLAGATLTLSSAAMALECKADAECGDGFYCEISVAPSTATNCAPGTNCQTPTPEPAPTTGYCQAKPLSCAADTDCPEYLQCAAPSYDCASPACAPGEKCEQPVDDCKPPTDAPKSCQVRTRECKADADCFANFHCAISQIEVACATPACPPGAKDCPTTPECDPGTTPPASQGYCEPKEITCAINSDCPSDWSCVEFQEGFCSGSGSTPPSMGGGSDGTPGSASSGTATPPPAPTPGNKPADTSGDGTTCETKVTRLCAPKGYVAASGGTAHDLASPESGTPTSGSKDSQGSSASAVGAPGAKGTGAASNGAASGTDDDTGCTVSGAGQHGGHSPAGLLVLGAAGLVAFLARRRRA